MAVLEATALAGEPCPTNPELGARLGYDSSYPSELMRTLEIERKIAVQRGTRGRIVTILADGPAKGFSTDSDAARIRRYHQVTRTIVRRTGREIAAAESGNPALPVDQLVARDPCLRCGTRGDLGCAHQAPVEVWRL
jgi:hypothetical protein